MPRELLGGRVARRRRTVGRMGTFRTVANDFNGLRLLFRNGYARVVSYTVAAHHIQLHSHELLDFALHVNELRRLAPAAIEQRICSHNTRCRGRLWLSHNADKQTGFDSPQAGAGTLTQRHRRLIGTRAETSSQCGRH